MQILADMSMSWLFDIDEYKARRNAVVLTLQSVS